MLIEISIEEYFNEVKQYLKDVINNLKKSDTWNIQLSITINSISSKEIVGESAMHSKSCIYDL